MVARKLKRLAHDGPRGHAEHNNNQRREHPKGALGRVLSRTAIDWPDEPSRERVMSRFVVMLLGAVLPATPLMAQTFFGHGNDSCGSWTQERRTNSWQSVAQGSWVIGFVNGVNASEHLLLKNPDFLQKTDGQAVLAWIDNHCRSHPPRQPGQSDSRTDRYTQGKCRALTRWTFLPE